MGESGEAIEWKDRVHHGRERGWGWASQVGVVKVIMGRKYRISLATLPFPYSSD